MTDQPSVVIPIRRKDSKVEEQQHKTRPAWEFLRELADDMERSKDREYVESLIVAVDFRSTADKYAASIEIRSNGTSDQDIALLVRAQHMVLMKDW